MVMVRITRAVSLGRRQIATSRTRRYRVRMLTCGQPRYRRTAAGSMVRPGPAARQSGWSAGVCRAGAAPQRGRSASPAGPLALNRLIHRRTVAGWQSGFSAIWAGAKPCAGSSTMNARIACRLAGWVDDAGNFDPSPGEADVNACQTPFALSAMRRPP